MEEITLRQIRSFLAVARTRSFTRAATSLRVSQPTLTVQIRTLEQALSVRLFDRTSRSVEPTRIARDLVPSLERMLADYDCVLDNVREISTSQRGTVRIAALPSFAASILPDAIRAFRVGRPRCSFVVRDVIANRIPGLLAKEEVELGVVGGTFARSDFDVLFTSFDHLSVVYPRGDPIGDLPRITAESLAARPLVLMDPDTSVRQITDNAFAKAGPVPIAAAEATYMMTAVGMVRAGLGLAILPASAREIHTEPGISRRLIDDPHFLRPISLIKKAGRSLRPMSQAFANELAAWLERALANPKAHLPERRTTLGSKGGQPSSAAKRKAGSSRKRVSKAG